MTISIFPAVNKTVAGKQRTNNWELRELIVVCDIPAFNRSITFGLAVYKIRATKQVQSYFFVRFPLATESIRTGYGMTWREFESVIRTHATAYAAYKQLTRGKVA